MTYGWIRNTLELARVGIGHNLRGNLQANVAVEGEIEVTWDERGNLVSPFGPRAASLSSPSGFETFRRNHLNSECLPAERVARVPALPSPIDNRRPPACRLFRSIPIIRKGKIR